MDIHTKQIENHIAILNLDIQDCENSISENLRRIDSLLKENELKQQRIIINNEAIKFANESLK